MIRDWLTLNATVIPDTVWSIFFGMSAMLTVGGALIVPLAKRRRSADRWMLRWIAEVRNRATVLGIVGFIILFFNTQQIQGFGARLWYAAWFIAMVFAIVRLWRRSVYWRKRRREDAKHAQLIKYLTPR